MNNRRREPFGFIQMLSKSQFPNLDSYICLSTVVSIIAAGTVATTFYATPGLKEDLEEQLKNNTRLSKAYGLNLEYLSTSTSFQMAHYVMSDPTYIWIAINTYFTILAICIKLIIRLAFKDLSRQEDQMARQAFCSYFLLTIVYLSVVTGPNKTHRVLPWMVWSGICGFLSHLQFITCQRLKFTSPSCNKGGQRMSFLSIFLFLVSLAMTGLVTRFQHHLAWQPAALLYLDCMLAFFRSTYIMLRCLSSAKIFSFHPDSVRHFNYWLELCTNFICEFIQMLSYVDLLIISPGLNLTSIFFLYHIKLTYSCMVEQLSRHRSHKRIFEHIETKYPSVKCEDSDDRCVVCWELLGTSRRLPCSHQFHDWCLMWWFAQDSSCPMCRVAIPSPLEEPTPTPNGTNTTFRFNGGQFAFVRLPAFTIEISTGLGPLFGRPSEPTEVELQAMVLQVQEMFPQMSIDTIMADLRLSGSAQSTIDNILEGRIGINNSQMPNMLEDDMTEESGSEMDDDEPVAIGDVEVERVRTWTKSETIDNMTYYEVEKEKMIAIYRQKYLKSDKAADLRAKGIYE